MSAGLGAAPVMGLQDWQRGATSNTVPSLLRPRPLAPASTLPVPPAPTPAPSPLGMPGGASNAGVTGVQGSSGDPTLDAIRNLTNANANAQTIGLRSAAMNDSRNDPALAAFAGLRGLIGGQSQAASGLNTVSANWLQALSQRAWDEHMAQIQQGYALDRARAGAANPLAQIGGALTGTLLGPVAKTAGTALAGWL